VDTETTGKIKVNFDEALTQAEFELRVFDGTGIRVAHFHCGRAGENGPVVVFIFGPVDAGVDVDGELAEGTVTNADYSVADRVSAIGRPVNNIASLAFAARDGLIYANVHSLAHTGGGVRGKLLEKK
jgi:hypothetical protein